MAANVGLPEGFVLDEQPASNQLPDGFVMDEQPINNQSVNSYAQGMTQTAQTLSDGQKRTVDGAMSLREKVIDSITGESKMTPEMESMKNVATAPELNSLSMDAIKAGWSQLFGSDASQQKILESMGGKSRQDEKGNVIISLPSGEYALNKPGLSPQDVTSFIANALAFTPAARAPSVVGATLKSGATDLALQGVTQTAGGEDIDPFQTAISAGIGGIGKGIENTVSAGARAAKGSLTPEQQAQIDFASQNNVPLMTSDMLKNKTLNQKDVQTFGDRIPFFGTGKARLNQKQERENLVRTFSDGLGDISDKQLYESATKGQQAFIKAAGARYEDIINKMGNFPVDLTQTVRAIDGQIANLTRPGASQDRAAVSVLKQFKDDITSGANNLRMARENRTDLRTRFMNSQDRVSSTSLEKASDSIYAAYTLDMKKAVHQKLGADEVLRMSRVDKSWAGFNGLMANTRVQKALQAGKVKPEEVTKLIFSQSAAERSQLYKLLDDNGRNKARSAMVQQAIDKATNSAGDLSVDTFLNEMHRNRKQAATFFRGEHGRQLDGLTKYLDSTRGASKANVQNLNGQQVYGALMGGGLAGAAAMIGAAKAALYIVPIAAATGGAARVYEGRMVRNALMRLANTPKGSTAYDRNISAVTQALTKSAQAAQRD